MILWTVRRQKAAIIPRIGQEEYRLSFHIWLTAETNTISKTTIYKSILNEFL